ncbi:MAG: saccharopine dehydrogenase NADP-binding domain-containing protein [candidate division SR1 bacterium]|nr:saccharopine dehydrogenase NADP-binding domain-containing protein [candidate division SR1 bacterium]
MVYLDRYGIAFRQNEKYLLANDEITVYRPGNRIYPHEKGWKIGEVVKTRVIEIPGDDKLGIYPVFSNEVGLVKITNIQLLHDYDLAKTPEILEHVKSVYIHATDFSLLTRIDMRKVNSVGLIDNSAEIKKFYDDGIITPAILPENNPGIDDLLKAGNFSMAFINHDYAALTPKMWNFIAKEYGLDIKTSMVVAKAENLAKIFDVLRLNKDYLGGGLGIGFKDTGYGLLHSDENKYFVDPVADAMQSTNFVAHFGNEIHGYNSDAAGYCESLTDKFKEIGKDMLEKNIIMLGAGGTARGIALELVHRGIKKLIIVNRTLEKAQAIADKLNIIKPDVAVAMNEESIFSFKEHIDAIINLSTKGADGNLEKFSGLTPASSLEENLASSKQLLQSFAKENPKLIVSDINLTKTLTTPLLDIAKEIGLPVLDGRGMVVYQGVDAIWTVFGDKITAKGGTKDEVRQKLIKEILK